MGCINYVLLSIVIWGASYGVATSSEVKSAPLTTIVALGDSLTEGYGLPREDAYPAQLEALLQNEGYAVRMLNHGIAGDTTAGGRSRIQHVLKAEPDLVIVELGPNDFLRGIVPSASKANLESIVKALTAADVRVLLVSFKAAPNIGPAFKAQFDQIFPDLADTYNIPLMYGFLDGVAGDPNLNLADGIHPNRQGYAIVARNVFPYVQRLLEQRAAQADTK